MSCTYMEERYGVIHDYCSRYYVSLMFYTHTCMHACMYAHALGTSTLLTAILKVRLAQVCTCTMSYTCTYYIMYLVDVA